MATTNFSGNKNMKGSNFEHQVRDIEAFYGKISGLG